LYGYDCLDASEDLTVEKIMNIISKDSKIDVSTLPQSSIDRIVKKNEYFIQQNNVITYKKEDNNKDLLMVALGGVLVGMLIILAAKKS